MTRRQSRTIDSTIMAVTLTALILLSIVAGPSTVLVSAHERGLDVTITETNSPVVEGDPLEVTVNVSNAGEDTHAEEITLRVGGAVRDSQTVELAGGENRTITLTWDTESGDAGEYQARVASANDTDSTTVTIEDAGPWYTVEIDDTNSPVVEGETLRVNATVQNIEDRSGNQTMELTVGGEVRDTRNVSLDGGESTTVSFTWSTSKGDGGNYTAVVESNQETASTSVQVKDAANFSVTIAGTNSPVFEGERLEVTAIIENTGDVAGSETVSLSVDAIRNNTVVNLSAGEQTQVTLSWATQDGDAGDYEASITVRNNTVSTSVSVLSPQDFEVTLLDTNAPIEAGEELRVTAVINNVGDRPGNQTVTLSVGGVVRDNTTVGLGANDNETVTLTWQTGSGDEGTYEATVATANDSASWDIEIQSAPPETTETNEPPVAGIDYQVDGTMPDTVTAGTAVRFEANASDPDGTIESYEWVVDGEVVSTDASFEYTFEEPGPHEVELRVTDDEGATATTSRTLEVGSPDPTTTEQTTAEPTQTTAYGPGLGIISALLALGLLVLGLRLRAA